MLMLKGGCAWFLVNSLDDGHDELLVFMDELNSADKIFSVQLVMNLDCNLDCGYLGKLKKYYIDGIIGRLLTRTPHLGFGQSENSTAL
jgi:hypothetical protein